jgi:hypothetical protein
MIEDAVIKLNLEVGGPMRINKGAAKFGDSVAVRLQTIFDVPLFRIQIDVICLAAICGHAVVQEKIRLSKTGCAKVCVVSSSTSWLQSVVCETVYHMLLHSAR